MKRNYAMLALCAVATVAIAGNDTLQYTHSLYYNNDDYQLSEKQRQEIQTFLTKTNNVPFFTIEIKGYTDVNGTDGYNNVLSRNRSNEVFGFIRKYGIATKNISQYYFGERFATEDVNKENYRKFRRVDITLKVVNHDSQSWLQSVNSSANQTMTIRTDSAYTLKGKHGAVIEIPREAFVGADGQPYKGNIAFELKEAVDPFSIISMGLTTMSDNQLLITRGMVYVSAQGNGQDLALADGKSLTITVPSMQNSETNMNVFYGEKKEDGSINWKKDSSAFMKKVKEVPININKEALARVTIPIPEVHFLKHEEALIMPNAPAKPYVPHKPQFPDSNRYRYYPSAVEKAFWSKEKMKRKNAEVYARVYQGYVERHKKYEAKMTALSEKMNQYNEAYKQYQQDSIVFESKIQDRVDKAMQILYAVAERNIAKHFTAVRCELMEKTVTSRTNLKGLLSTNRSFTNIDELFVFEKILGKEAFKHFFRGKDNGCLSERENYANRINDYINYNMRLYRGNIIDSMATTCGLKQALDNMQTEWMDSMAQLGLLNTRSFDGYVANVGRLGWINCDRFYNFPEAQKMIVKVNEPEDATMYLVMKNEAAFMKLNKNGEQYTMSGLPKNGSYKLIAVKMVDNKPMLAIQDMNRLPSEPINLNYAAGSVTQLKNELSGIVTL